MRIATYNFLGGGSRKRDRHWELLRDLVQPDLLFTQECRPIEVGEEACFLWAEAVPRGWGTGLYARAASIERLVIRNFKGWVTGGRIADAPWSPVGSIVAFSIHCPAGEHGYIRTMHGILDRIARFRNGCDLIIGGDINAVCGYRSTDDVVKMSRGEKELLDRLCGEFELIACWQTAHPGKRLAQTLRWSGNRKTPYHCDGIFVPASWRSDLEYCDVLNGPEWDQQSDHNPIVAVVEPARVPAMSMTDA